jgi:anti-sigma B factor antagonist
VKSHPQFYAEILRPREQVAVLAVDGDVDVHAGPRFKELILALLAEGPRHLIVDLSTATALDSTGLGILVSCAKRARASSLAIVCCDQALTNVFALIGLDRIFRVFGSRAAALAAAC